MTGGGGDRHAGIRRVVLLHGLWMAGWSMRRVARRLRAAGFAPEVFTYPSVRGGPGQAIPRLAACLRRSPAHVVAHSLGGLVTLATLQREPALPVGRVACLGSPLRGSAAASGLASHAWGEFALGRSTALLREGCGPCAEGVEVGVVAGGMPFGLGRLVGSIDGDNDGTVAVEETRIAGLADHVTVRASHTGLLLSAHAADQVIAFLRTGRFSREPPPPIA